MISYKQIVGNQEDWANIVTNVEMIATPFLDWLPVSDKIENVEKSYQAEVYRRPRENSHTDGTPVTGFDSAGDSRARLRALCQYFVATSSVTRLHQDVSDIDAITDELSNDILKRTKELSTDMEAAFLEDDDCREDNGVQGYKTRGVGSWIQTGAQSLYPVPAAFRPPTASVSATATGSLTENTVLDILASMGEVTKSKEPITAFVGHKSKRAFNNMPLFTPSSTLVGGSPTGATGVVHTKPLKDRAIDRTIERYNSDFGPVDLVMSWYQLALGGNDIEKAFACYFLHQSRWSMAWGPGASKGAASGKPTWFRKEYEGGSYEAFCESIAMLICLNPKGEAKYQPTT
jgi:hypothetical protein